MGNSGRRAREARERAEQSRRYWEWVDTLPTEERDRHYEQNAREVKVVDRVIAALVGVCLVLLVILFVTHRG